MEAVKLWPRKFHFFKEVFREVTNYMLLNTIRLHSERGGLSYSGVCSEYEDVPKTRVYRAIKAMEEKGWLVAKEQKTGGRPKRLYGLSSAGEAELERLRETLLSFLQSIRDHFPRELEGEPDPRQFLENLTFTSFVDPVHFILHQDMPEGEKLELLERLAGDLEEKLEHVRETIMALESPRPTGGAGEGGGGE
ncbi:MAG: helix-turn-helix transcriptional regulator [Promethearchaeota archaeon]